MRVVLKVVKHHVLSRANAFWYFFMVGYIVLDNKAYKSGSQNTRFHKFES